MGGSGGGLRMSLGEIAELEAKAKAVLREGDIPRKNIFISFAHEDINAVHLLRGQAKNASTELEFNDWSLKEPFDSERAEYIRKGIRERIRQSSLTLVYVSEITCESSWVDWEVRESIKMGKRVVAMYSGATPPVRLPAALVENGIRPIRWEHQALMSAINNP